MASVLRLVYDDGNTAIAFNMRAPARVGAIASGELMPEVCCEKSGLTDHQKNRLLRPEEERPSDENSLEGPGFCATFSWRNRFSARDG